MKTDTLTAEQVLPFVGTPFPGGVANALARHYDDLVAHVRRHIGKRGGDRAVAREVVHDIYLELIDTPPSTKIHTPLAFLREVATRRAIDRYRLETGRCAWLECTGDVPEYHDGKSCCGDPARIVAGRQCVKVLADAIDALPPRCREVFVLHKLHGWPQREVAEQLHISLKTVEKHLRLGLASCRAAVGDAA